MKVTTRLTTLLLIVSHIGSAFGQITSTTPSWRHIPGNWPNTSNQVRAMVSSNGELYVGIAGTVANSAQVWKLAGSDWVKHAGFESLKVAVLQTDTAGNLYVGTGTPHSAELPGRGHAEVWKVDTAGETRQLRTFKNKDLAYSMVWFQEKLHVGTMTEDLRGTAEIWRFDDPGWTQIAGRGINGWPADNSYAAVYEMWVHDGALIAGTFSRTAGDGDVLKLAGNRWIDLNAPTSIIALSFETYQGQLVTSLSNSNARHPNPIFALQTDGTWQPLGKAPAEWNEAFIPNHLVVNGTEMYVGIGGRPGTLSVWEYDGTFWTKLAGDGLSGSWVDPLVSQGAEWVYRLTLHQGKLYAGLASDRVPFQAQVWELTP
jgi:hypothetical protein